MKILSQIDCCLLLGIDPKTLRNWLKCAQIQSAAHPTDARIKSLTLQQVQQVATLHARPLLEASLLCSFEEPTRFKQESASLLIPATISCPSSQSEVVELKKTLSSLESKVKYYLGTTDHLTLACLEQRATKLQSSME